MYICRTISLRIILVYLMNEYSQNYVLIKLVYLISLFNFQEKSLPTIPVML